MLNHRMFVMMPEFDRQWRRLGLGDVELRYVQQELIENPKAGSVIGHRGITKISNRIPRTRKKLKWTGRLC